MKKILIAICVIMILGGVAMFFLTKQKEIRHIEEKICLEITSNMVIEQYDSDIDEYGEEHGSIKILVKYSIDQIKEMLEVQYGKDYVNTDYMNLFHHEDRDLWDEMQKYDIEAYYFKMVSGRKAKTICIEVYVISDEDNYLYIFY